MSTRTEIVAEVRRWLEKAENDFRNAEYVLTMEDNPPPAPNGGVCGIIATVGNTSGVNISPGQSEVVVTGTDWTRGAGLTGPFLYLLIHNPVGNPNWEPGTIVVQWLG